MTVGTGGNSARIGITWNGGNWSIGHDVRPVHTALGMKHRKNGMQMKITDNACMRHPEAYSDFLRVGQGQQLRQWSGWIQQTVALKVTLIWCLMILPSCALLQPVDMGSTDMTPERIAGDHESLASVQESLHIEMKLVGFAPIKPPYMRWIVGVIAKNEANVPLWCMIPNARMRTEKNPGSVMQVSIFSSASAQGTQTLVVRLWGSDSPYPWGLPGFYAVLLAPGAQVMIEGLEIGERIEESETFDAIRVRVAREVYVGAEPLGSWLTHRQPSGRSFARLHRTLPNPIRDSWTVLDEWRIAGDTAATLVLTDEQTMLVPFNKEPSREQESGVAW